jgi:hypothetical protein
MKRYNALASKSTAEARASYRELGLCYVCGIDEKSCLHVDVKRRMGEPAYSEWIASFNGIGPGYDNLIIQRRIFAEKQAERDKRDKAEAIRVSTGLLDRTPTAAQLRAREQQEASLREQVNAAYMQALQTKLECICTQIFALEPTVNPDCPLHGSLNKAEQQTDVTYMQALQSDEAEQEQLWGCLGILVDYIPPEPEAQDAENQIILDWLEGWNKSRPSPLGESPTETRSQFTGF